MSMSIVALPMLPWTGAIAAAPVLLKRLPRIDACAATMVQLLLKSEHLDQWFVLTLLKNDPPLSYVDGPDVVPPPTAAVAQTGLKSEHCL